MRIFVYEADEGDRGTMIYNFTEEDQLGDQLKGRRSVGMESTSFKDKVGKEIYEGDLLSNTEGNVRKVIWHDDNWTLYDKTGRYFPLLAETGISEVVGNIYENKGLLI